MQPLFDHDLAKVRVFDGAEENQLTEELGARALTVGSDLWFARGEYDPASVEGRRVLAHELTHVVQNERFGSPCSSEVLSSRDSSAEREAERASSAVVAGVPASISSPPAAQVARLEPLIESSPWDSLRSVASFASDTVGALNPLAAPARAATEVLGEVVPSLGGLSPATSGMPPEGGVRMNDSGGGLSSAWDAVSSVGRGALGAANTLGTTIVDVQNAIGGGMMNAYDDASSLWNKVAPDFNKANKDLGSLVDLGERGVASVGKSAVAATSDIPILGDIVQANTLVANAAAETLGGSVKGAGDLTAFAGNAMVHPIDTAKGMLGGILGMAEHTPGPAGTALKGAHGLFDIATGNKKGEYGSSLGELGTNLMDSDKQTEGDVKFWAGFGGGTQVWHDKPAEAMSRTLMNFLPMALGMAPGEGPIRAPVVEGPSPPVIEPGVSPMAKSVPGNRLPGIAPPESPISPAAKSVPSGGLPGLERPGVDPMAPTLPDPGLAPTVRQGPVYEPVRYGVEVGPNGEVIPSTVEVPRAIEHGPPTKPGLGPEEPVTWREKGPPTERSTPTRRGVGDPGPPLPEETPRGPDRIPETQRSPGNERVPDTERTPDTEPAPDTERVPDTERTPDTDRQSHPIVEDESPLPSTQPRPHPHRGPTPVERALEPYRNMRMPPWRMRRWWEK